MAVTLSVELLNARTIVHRKAPLRLETNVTMSPTPFSSRSTNVPTRTTQSPSIGSSNKPILSSQPTKVVVTSLSPTQAPVLTESPTTQPSLKPSLMPTKAPHHESLWSFFLKLIGYLIFIGLSAVLFGMCMSYRYHIYYFLLQVRTFQNSKY